MFLNTSFIMEQFSSPVYIFRTCPVFHGIWWHILNSVWWNSLNYNLLFPFPSLWCFSASFHSSCKIIWILLQQKPFSKSEGGDICALVSISHSHLQYCSIVLVYISYLWDNNHIRKRHGNSLKRNSRKLR